MTIPVKAQFESIAPALLSADRVLIYAGAGTSVELGIGTYWTGADSKYGSNESKHGFTALEHAHASLWRTHPEEQKQYFAEQYLLFQEKLQQSNENFYTKLLSFLTKHGKDYFVVTSNIDNAFLHYGFDENKVFEVHGNQTYTQCADCDIQPANGTGNCPVCGLTARPNVLYFDDFSFDVERILSQETRYLYTLDEALDEVDMQGKTKTCLLEVGVGTTVPRIRDMATKAFYRLNRPLIHVNPTFDPGSNYSQLAQYMVKETPNHPDIWVLETASSFGEKLTSL